MQTQQQVLPCPEFPSNVEEKLALLHLMDLSAYRTYLKALNMLPFQDQVMSLMKERSRLGLMKIPTLATVG